MYPVNTICYVILISYNDDDNGVCGFNLAFTGSDGGQYLSEWNDNKSWEGTSYEKNSDVTNTISEGVKKPAN